MNKRNDRDLRWNHHREAKIIRNISCAPREAQARQRIGRDGRDDEEEAETDDRDDDAVADARAQFRDASRHPT